MSLAAAGLFAVLATARAASVPDCERAGAAAERANGLPPGLLLAVGRVESGRWDSQAGRLVAWPWSIDVDGDPQVFGDAAAAIRAVEQAQAAGHRSIDVGCFQINLAWHPLAFSSLAQAFDPDANAGYAARYLESLKLRLGSWPAAIAAYHSANPELGTPYRDRVLALWSDSHAPAPAFESDAARYGMRIWTPGGSAWTSSLPQSAIQSASPSSAAGAAVRPILPRIITPGR